MPAIVVGDFELAWDYGPSFAQACGVHEQSELSPESALEAQLTSIASSLSPGNTADGDAVVQRILAATAAYLYLRESYRPVINVEVEEGS